MRLASFGSATSTCPVTALSFCSDGNKCLIAANNLEDSKAKILVFDIKNIQRTLQIELQQRVNFATFLTLGEDSEDDIFLLACTGEKDANSGEASIWQIGSDLNSKNRFRSFTHHGAVECAAFSQDRKHIVTGSQDKTACILDVQKEESDAGFARLLPHPANIISTAFSPNGQLIATACRDQSVRIWSTSTAELITTFGCSGTPERLIFSDDGQLLFAQAGSDKTLIWDLTAGTHTPITLEFNGDVGHTLLESNGSYLVTVVTHPANFLDRLVQVWDIVGQDAPKRIWDFRLGPNEFLTVDAVSINPKGDCVVLCGEGKVGLFSRGDASSSNYSELPKMGVAAASFSPDGSKVLIAGNTITTPSQGVVCLWNINENFELTDLASIEGQIGKLSTACFSPDSRHVLTCGSALIPDIETQSYHGEAIIWKIESQSLTLHKKLERQKETLNGATFYRGHKEPVTFGTFSPDKECTFVVTTSVDDTACVWSTRAGGTPIATLGREFTNQYHTADVVSAAFVPDKINLLATVGEDGRVMLWDFKKQEALHVLNHDEMLNGVTFSKNGRHFLTRGVGASARIWDTAAALAGPSSSVSPLLAVLDHSGPMVSAVAHPTNGNRFLTMNTVGPIPSSKSVNKKLSGTDNLRNEGTAQRGGIQISEWDLSPADSSLVTAYEAASKALAQRRVNSESQRLESIERKDLIEFLKDAKPLSRYSLSKQNRIMDWNRREAAQAEMLGNWYAAAWHLGQLIESGNGSDEILTRRANCYARHGWYRQAISDWESVCETQNSDGQLNGYIGLAQSEADLATKGLSAIAKIDRDSKRLLHAKNAIQFFDKAIEIDSSRVDLIAQRGHLKFLLGQNVLAVDDLTKAIESLNSTLPNIQLSDLYKLRAKIFGDAGEKGNATADFRKAGDLYSAVFDAASLNEAIVAYKLALNFANEKEREEIIVLQSTLMLNSSKYSDSKSSTTLVKQGISQLEKLAPKTTDWKLLLELARACSEIAENEKSVDYYFRGIEEARKQTVAVEEIQSIFSEFKGLLKRQSEWKRLTDLLSTELELSVSDVGDNSQLYMELAMAHSRLKQWEPTITNLDKVIELKKQNQKQPDRELYRLHTLRASAFAEQGLWIQAADDLSIALSLTGVDDSQQQTLTQYRTAVARLMEGNIEGYRECCRQILDTYDKAASAVAVNLSPTTRNNVAWTLSLGAESGIAASKATEIANLAVKEKKTTLTYRNTLRTALFREGKFDDVLDSWASEEEKAKTSDSSDPIAFAADCFVLAMTHHSKSNGVDSRTWFDEGAKMVKKIEEMAIAGDDSLEGMSIWSRREIQILEIEAKKLLEQVASGSN
jgi:WD40 repeat protein